MPNKFSDDEINALIKETKPLPKNYRNFLRLNDKRGHKESELDVVGEKGDQFRLIFRQSNINNLDFSVILAFCPKGTNQVFRLRRYNGKSHEHTNKIECSTFYGFHIHTATERYQELGSDPDSFAEQSSKYYDFNSAVHCLFDDCGLVIPKGDQLELFK